jgi:nucleoside-diphosphate-sugar epimerase
VKDVVKAMLLVTEKCPISKAVNIGSTKSTSMKELIHMIAQLTGIKRNIVFDTSKPEGAKHKSVDINLLKEVIGFKPRTTLEEGLFETIKFYKDESGI